MSITVGQIRLGVLHEMREFSNSGSIQAGADIKDYELSIIPLLNIYVPELATTTHKLERKTEIAQNMPTNMLGLINWNEEKVHAGGVDDEFIYVGANSFSVQVSGRATITIYEEVAGVWTQLRTETNIPTSGEGYVTYKGLTNAVNPTNRVKLVLSGAYRYPYRWVALFNDKFFNDSEVPTFEPYVPYALPTDAYQLDKVMWSHPERQLGDYAAFKTDFTTAVKKVLINWYEKGEFIVKYYAYPREIPTPNPSNISASDTELVDIADECKATLIHRICGTLQRDENPYMADTLESFAQISKAELVQNSSYESGYQGIINNSNW
jgi:hypothetical protein